ncbi:MAG: butyrate kinase [Synergistaceae bacterium]|jgi:butyrate kinase|nr:butyrate kinase [Synergistaceae bacterium]
MKVLSFIAKLASTEFAIYKDEVETHYAVVQHPPLELNALLSPREQGEYRFSAVMGAIESRGISINDVDIVITQAGVEALSNGIYLVNDALRALMAESRIDENAPRSAVFMASRFANLVNSMNVCECLPLVVEPALDDEIITDAALSGLKGVGRAPVFHSFSHRAAASVIAWETMKTGPNGINLVIAHLGKEISVCAYDKGRIVDSNSPLDGEGPFSPTAAGSLPTKPLLELCYAMKYDMDEMMSLIQSSGGLAAHLGDATLQKVEEAYSRGDKKTIFLVKAMAYKVAREIGAKTSSLFGNVDRIVITGPWALFENFVKEIIPRVEWIAPTRVYVWKSELYLLMTSAARAFDGSQKIELYGR